MHKFPFVFLISAKFSPIAKLLNGTPENASKVAHEKDSNNAPSDHSAPSPAEERNSLNVGSPEEELTNKTALSPKNEPLASNHDRITHGKHKCKCRKRRAKVQ